MWGDRESVHLMKINKKKNQRNLKNLKIDKSSIYRFWVWKTQIIANFKCLNEFHAFQSRIQRTFRYSLQFFLLWMAVRIPKFTTMLILFSILVVFFSLWKILSEEVKKKNQLEIRREIFVGFFFQMKTIQMKFYGHLNKLSA